MLTIGLMGLIGLVGCAHRVNTDIDVDRVQAYVDRVESFLDQGKQALEKDDVQTAEKKFKSAVAAFHEHQVELTAYPEIDQLRAKLRRSAKLFCLHQVNGALSGFLQAIREEQLESAQGRMELVQREFSRCQDKIADLPEYIPIKMSMDSAQGDLDKLKKKLVSRTRQEQFQEARKKVHDDLAEVEKGLAQLKLQPNQKELARELSARLGGVRSLLDRRADLAGLNGYKAFESEARARLKKLDQEHEGLVHQGQVLWVRQEIVQFASRHANEAVLAENVDKAAREFTRALDAYRKCENGLRALLQSDPQLADFRIEFEGRRRNAAWLYEHCGYSRQISQAMLAVLGLVAKTVPEATELGTRAATAGGAEAARLFDQAHQRYGRCEAVLKEVINLHGRLAGYRFPFQGDRKSVGWLQEHCQLGRSLAAQQVLKQTGRRPAPMGVALPVIDPVEELKISPPDVQPDKPDRKVRNSAVGKKPAHKKSRRKKPQKPKRRKIDRW